MAPDAQLIYGTADTGEQTVYLIDPARESFARLTEDLTEDKEGWRVWQGGPVGLWDEVERTVAAWEDAGKPDITEVRVRVTKQSHLYWVGNVPGLRWEHRLGLSGA